MLYRDILSANIISTILNTSAGAMFISFRVLALRFSATNCREPNVYFEIFFCYQASTWTTILLRGWTQIL